ncbi:hypothetical protein FH972_025486 [Carpinus fangiana]|uniref:Uncharacterized protein n=1 Tax=Carpinus fangiana TaxID=176857 RepID=A0A5N6L3R8_9ROSI|nr:hypothetical protein FH972_025486 [Carpinus fangiana]
MFLHETILASAFIALFPQVIEAQQNILTCPQNLATETDALLSSACASIQSQLSAAISNGASEAAFGATISYPPSSATLTSLTTSRGYILGTQNVEPGFTSAIIIASATVTRTSGASAATKTALRSSNSDIGIGFGFGTLSTLPYPVGSDGRFTTFTTSGTMGVETITSFISGDATSKANTNAGPSFKVTTYTSSGTGGLMTITSTVSLAGVNAASPSMNSSSGVSKSTIIGAIVGSILGCMLLVTFAVLIFCLFRRRRRLEDNDQLTKYEKNNAFNSRNTEMTVNDTKIRGPLSGQLDNPSSFSGANVSPTSATVSSYSNWHGSTNPQTPLPIGGAWGSISSNGKPASTMGHHGLVSDTHCKPSNEAGQVNGGTAAQIHRQEPLEYGKNLSSEPKRLDEASEIVKRDAYVETVELGSIETKTQAEGHASYVAESANGVATNMSLRTEHHHPAQITAHRSLPSGKSSRQQSVGSTRSIVSDEAPVLPKMDSVSSLGPLFGSTSERKGLEGKSTDANFLLDIPSEDTLYESTSFKRSASGNGSTVGEGFKGSDRIQASNPPDSSYTRTTMYSNTLAETIKAGPVFTRVTTSTAPDIGAFNNFDKSNDQPRNHKKTISARRRVSTSILAGPPLDEAPQSEHEYHGIDMTSMTQSRDKGNISAFSVADSIHSQTLTPERDITTSLHVPRRSSKRARRQYYYPPAEEAGSFDFQFTKMQKLPAVRSAPNTTYQTARNSQEHLPDNRNTPSSRNRQLDSSDDQLQIAMRLARPTRSRESWLSESSEDGRSSPTSPPLNDGRIRNTIRRKPVSPSASRLLSIVNSPRRKQGR